MEADVLAVPDEGRKEGILEWKKGERVGSWAG
jgi:hypothetical protein